MLELHTIKEIQAHLDSGAPVEGVVFQGVSLLTLESRLNDLSVNGSIFLGCEMTSGFALAVQQRGGVVFPKMDELPFNPFRPHLYTAEELFGGFELADPCSYCDTLDARVYRHWETTGRASPRSVVEGIMRRTHDQSVTDAMLEFLEKEDRKVVAIMGGHSMKRTDARYREVALISRALTREGYLMVSGGGPGAMEATHLGAWFTERPDDEIEEAIAILSEAPSYKDLEWLARAFHVREKYPRTSEASISLGIPTWLYGHEPPTPFASHIAKYFANSLREEGLISIAVHGILFSPGSAGTIQEIFQDVTQNHYGTLGMVSPMIFYDRDFWTEKKPIYPLIQQLAEGHRYGKLLALADDVDEALEAVRRLEPIPWDKEGWHFCRAHCSAAP